MINNIIWENNVLKLLDQQLLPHQLKYLICNDYHDVAWAIKSMKVRGAPAIGVSAAFGIVLAAQKYGGTDRVGLDIDLNRAYRELASTRPTAVNLFWALERMKKVWMDNSADTAVDITGRLVREACAIMQEDIEICNRIGHTGNSLIPANASVLTHCNAGALATAGCGTALSVIRAAHSSGKSIHVYVDETRPLLQGTRLTAWELLQDNIPATLITDNMAGYLMQQEKIDLVVVGADRITTCGDIANKIGTYSVAVLAKYHNIPFYVAAPLSTFDLKIKEGSEIPIEERDHDEVRKISLEQIAPQNVPVYNPSFDITPACLIDGIITEAGILRPPFVSAIKDVF